MIETPRVIKRHFERKDKLVEKEISRNRRICEGEQSFRLIKDRVNTFKGGFNE